MFQHWKCDISTNIRTLISYANVGEAKNQHWYKWKIPRMVYCLPTLDDKIVTPHWEGKLPTSEPLYLLPILVWLSTNFRTSVKYQQWSKATDIGT